MVHFWFSEFDSSLEKNSSRDSFDIAVLSSYIGCYLFIHENLLVTPRILGKLNKINDSSYMYLFEIKIPFFLHEFL